MTTTPPRAASRCLSSLLVAGLAAAALLPSLLEAQQDDPWSWLKKVRDSLVQAGPTQADFLQTYVPAGFSSGETESGRIAIALPDCLRWDYADPYPKVFLVCGDSAHYWNPQDGSGRRFEIDREEEPGLDLVLLSIEDLRRRYRVESGNGSTEPAEGQIVLRLVPIPGSSQASESPLSEATLVVDRRSLRVVRLSYEDDEGNLTRFEIDAYRPLTDRSLFSPPEGIEWREGRGDDETP